MDMVEKVAIKAMLACHEQESVCGPFVSPMERWVDDPVFRLYWRHIAEGAIEAMMEPTEEALAEFRRLDGKAYTVHFDSREAGHRAQALWTWKHVIRAALTSEGK